ncbi:MAG: hypothetical protein ABIF22_00305 [bacterium]
MLILLELIQEIRFAVIHKEKIIDKTKRALAEKAFLFFEIT